MAFYALRSREVYLCLDTSSCSHVEVEVQREAKNFDLIKISCKFQEHQHVMSFNELCLLTVAVKLSHDEHFITFSNQ